MSGRWRKQILTSLNSDLCAPIGLDQIECAVLSGKMKRGHPGELKTENQANYPHEFIASTAKH